MSDSMIHGPLTALQALRADGGSAVDEQAARLAFARRVIAASIARDPWGNDPDRTTRNWRPETCCGTFASPADDRPCPACRMAPETAA